MVGVGEGLTVRRNRQRWADHLRLPPTAAAGAAARPCVRLTGPGNGRDEGAPAPALPDVVCAVVPIAVGPAWGVGTILRGLRVHDLFVALLAASEVELQPNLRILLVDQAELCASRPLPWAPIVPHIITIHSRRQFKGSARGVW
jgi:hypothetical protein